MTLHQTTENKKIKKCKICGAKVTGTYGIIGVCMRCASTDDYQTEGVESYEFGYKEKNDHEEEDVFR